MMRVSILYNFPLGKDSARVSLGVPNVEDRKYEFHLSFIDEQGHGGWVKPGWVSYDKVSELHGLIKKNWKVIVEKRDLLTQKVIRTLEIDFGDKEWPLMIEESSVVDSNYWI